MWHACRSRGRARSPIPGRAGQAVGRWVHELAARRRDAEFELVDLADHDIALLDDPTVPGGANRQYASENTRRWGQKTDELDGFVFVTPEYNHGVPLPSRTRWT